MNNALKAIPVSLIKFVLMDFAFYTNVQVLFIVPLALNVQEASARNRRNVALTLQIVQVMKCVMESFVSRNTVKMMIVL